MFQFGPLALLSLHPSGTDVTIVRLVMIGVANKREDVATGLHGVNEEVDNGGRNTSVALGICNSAQQSRCSIILGSTSQHPKRSS